MIAWFAVLGLLVGSFLNVVLLRFRSSTHIGGRSHCPSCKTTLVWYELLPVISFLVLRGRCRSCQTSISWQYPAVELLSAGVFAGVGVLSGVAWITLPLLALGAMLVLFLVYDIKHQIIPDPWVLIFFGITVLYLIVQHAVGVDIDWLEHGSGAVLVPLPLLIICGITKGRGMGFGDVKFMIPMGLWLGISSGFAGLLMAFLIGGVYGMLVLLARFILRLITDSGGAKYGILASRIPFGPFLIIGAAVAFSFDVQTLEVVSWIQELIYGW